jgi:tRNA-specific 2-thiouridylase
MTARQRVAVAMSGGVDSSVAASLLVEQGIETFGLMMRLWSPGPDQYNRCCSPQDVAVARRVANQLGIPFYVLDAKEPFKHMVVEPFIDGYAKGVTPNPCIACNKHIRWGFLLDRALAMGATYLATGHYARVMKNNEDYQLLRARDPIKDQSYVLSVIKQEALARAFFPLGELSKAEVRQHARRIDLPVAEKPESQDLCFVPEGDYRTFLHRQAACLPPPGPITDVQGNVLGFHQGLADYTIGQRRGIGIARPHPLYVLEKVIATNTLIVGPHQALGRSRFIAGPVNWVSGTPPQPPIRVSVQIRYRAREVSAKINLLEDDMVEVDLEETLPDITPGQAAVFYCGDVCLGGGTIRP